MAKSHLNCPWLKVLIFICYLPNSNRDARLEFQNGHVPRSICFDLLGATDPNSNFSHTLPDSKYFVGCVGNHGITGDDALVLYDVEIEID